MRLFQANLVTKTIFDNTISSLDSKTAANKTENDSIENELKKLKTFDLSYFIGKSHFEEDGAQNYLVFQPIIRYFKITANTKFISSWKSKGLSDATITPYATSENGLSPLIDHYSNQVRIKVNKSCLKQPQIGLHTLMEQEQTFLFIMNWVPQVLTIVILH